MESLGFNAIEMEIETETFLLWDWKRTTPTAVALKDPLDQHALDSKYLEA